MWVAMQMPEVLEMLPLYYKAERDDYGVWSTGRGTKKAYMKYDGPTDIYGLVLIHAHTLYIHAHQFYIYHQAVQLL